MSNAADPLSDQEMSILAARTAALAFAGDKEGARKTFSQIPQHRRWAFKERVIMTFAVLQVAQETIVFAVN
jgi:hypothetical protein